MEFSKPANNQYANMNTGKTPDIDMPPISQEVEQELETAPHTEVEEVVETKTQPTPEPIKAESAQAKNFAALREKAERAERERDEYARRLAEMQPKTKPMEMPAEEDNDFQLEPDAVAEGKHLTKMQKEVKKLKAELNQYKQQTTVSVIEAKIKSQFPDFEKVVNSETIAMLNTAYPELANTLGSSADLYSKAITAYQMIKKFGIANEEPYKQDIERIKANSAKPKPLVSGNTQQGESPLTRANAFASGLTDELKQQLIKEMQDARKNY